MFLSDETLVGLDTPQGLTESSLAGADQISVTAIGGDVYYRWVQAGGAEVSAQTGHRIPNGGSLNTACSPALLRFFGAAGTSIHISYFSGHRLYS